MLPTSSSKIPSCLLQTCRVQTGACKRTIRLPFFRLYSSRPVNQVEKDPSARPKVTIHHIQKMYKKKEPITMITAQDYPSALFADRAGIDTCLVGDSLGMVELGYETTVPLTIDEILHHCRAVARGAKASFKIADLPFGTYEIGADIALKNAIRLIKEGNMEAVKMEGGAEIADIIHRMTSVGIPVLGHIGLTPQRQSSLGGYRVQGKTAAKTKQLLEDALQLQKAGCFAVVLEAVPEASASYVTERLKIPTIGIGAGSGCSGQVLVQNDMLGMFDRFMPRFCKQYADLSSIITNALREYHEDVKLRRFPGPEHCYPMAEGEVNKLKEMIAKEKAINDSKIALESRVNGTSIPNQIEISEEFEEEEPLKKAQIGGF
ncbi:uncharacterized protein VTP21DRAFT_3966 [Calcarisporiella thermophila]|uniref:uncharacterized protein n=1 Tax=Calcarisporiella thermophila TaxID=911321 RepID=UPI0037447496